MAVTPGSSDGEGEGFCGWGSYLNDELEGRGPCLNDELEVRDPCPIWEVEGPGPCLNDELEGRGDVRGNWKGGAHVLSRNWRGEACD